MSDIEHEDTQTEKQELQRSLEELRASNANQATRVKELEEAAHREIGFIVQLREDMAEQQDRSGDLETKIERLQSDLEKHRADRVEADKLTIESQDKEDRLVALRHELEHELLNFANVEKELAHVKQQLGSKTAAKAEIGHQIEITKRNAVAACQESELTAKTISSIETEAANAQSTLKALAIDLKTAESERDDLNSKLDEARESNSAVLDEVAAQKQRIEEEQQRVTAVKINIQSLQKDSMARAAQSRKLETATKKLQEMVKQLKIEHEWQEKYAKRLTEAVTAQRRGVFELQNEVPAMETVVAKRKTEKDRLEEQNKQYIEEHDVLNSKVETLKKHTMSLDSDAAR